MSKEKNKHPQTRDLVLFKNYDLYPNSGEVDTSFYQELYKYKSVEDYLKQKKKKKKNKSKKRKLVFQKISSYDELSIHSPEFSGANPFGFVGHVTPPNSFWNEELGNLNYGVNLDKEIDLIEELYSEESPPQSPSSIHGMQDDLTPAEDRYGVYEGRGDKGLRITDTFTGIYDGVPNPTQKY